jgi:stearoyl-CoA desaturase (delta-9 desaturase)
VTEAYLRGPDERVNWIRSIPFVLIHLSVLAVFLTGVRWIDVAVCIGLYYVRMFFITAGYHRYFSHRSYKMGRVMQFLMALGGTTAAQKGVLWWAANHRHHHRYSDMPEDVHSPKRGFWWSHVGWILCDKYEATDHEAIKDFSKYPELRFLNRFHLLPPTLLGVAVFLALGWSGLVVGFLLSTVLLWHGTFTVNSLAHVFGRRRFVTTDTSRNSLILALITCGEGWHNNHHHYQSTANQGFYWWEVDLSYYVLRAMSWVGLTQDLRTPAPAVLQRNRLDDGYHDVGLLGALPAKAAALPAKARAVAEQIAEGTRAPSFEPLS